ncbi:MAG: transposase, partial [Deltaproteobacteria bacterium]|nr:transposase [Deltaproteobacteria bacterium]
GGHKLNDARLMVRNLCERLTTKPLFVSDELAHYKRALAEQYHTVVPYERTGQRGRPRKPKVVIDDDLQYCTVHKYRRNGRVVKTNRTVIFGDEVKVKEILEKSPSRTINTAYVERSNASLRLWDSHLTRKCLTFCKSLDFLKAKLAICLLYYNFIRPHASLSYAFNNDKGKKILVPITPAMAAGITDRPLTLEELVTLNCVH